MNYVLCFNTRFNNILDGKIKTFSKTEIVKLKSEKPIGRIATITQTYRS